MSNGNNQMGGPLAWVGVLGAIGAAMAAIVGPIKDLTEARLRTAEIELEKTKARQEYVLKTFGDFDIEEQLALLQFLQNEYPDPVTQRWVSIQASRLEATLSDQAIQNQAQLEETKEVIKATVEERAPDRASGQGRIEDELLPEEVLQIQSQQSSIVSAQRQLYEAKSLVAGRMDIGGVAEEAVCDASSLRAQVYKPFASDRMLNSYDREERVGIVRACLEVRPRGSSEWTAQFLGPNDKIAKRITCSCP